MKRFTKTEMKAGHFLLVIFLFFIVTYLIGSLNLNKKPVYNAEDYLVELDSELFQDSIKHHLSYVLFYTENSDFCEKMKYNLNCFAKTKLETAQFFKVDVEKHPEDYMKYNVSGIPNIIIFNNGEEVRRIMGVIPEYNLEKIYHLITRQNKSMNLKSMGKNNFKE